MGRPSEPNIGRASQRELDPGLVSEQALTNRLTAVRVGGSFDLTEDVALVHDRVGRSLPVLDCPRMCADRYGPRSSSSYVESRQ